jgi:isopropylmalate/homocitrate/citramalate synthase
MNTSDLKIHLAQSILNLDDNALLKKINDLIKQESKKAMSKEVEPMSLEELYARIEESNKDIQEGRTKSALELLKKYSNQSISFS